VPPLDISRVRLARARPLLVEVHAPPKDAQARLERIVAVFGLRVAWWEELTIPCRSPMPEAPANWREAAIGVDEASDMSTSLSELPLSDPEGLVSGVYFLSSPGAPVPVDPTKSLRPSGNVTSFPFAMF
jgi:hypothetical protein